MIGNFFKKLAEGDPTKSVASKSPNESDFFEALTSSFMGKAPDKDRESISVAKMPPATAQKPTLGIGFLNNFIPQTQFATEASDNRNSKEDFLVESGVNQKLVEMLTTENQAVKQLLDAQSLEMEDLREQADTLKILESEAQDENEMLRFKVMSLEAELKMQNGQSLPNLDFTNQLSQQNNELRQQVASLQQQLKFTEALMTPDQHKQTQTEFDDPKQLLQELKQLYESFKIKFEPDDELRVIKAIYLNERPVIRLYRELLFQKVAQRAIESAEFLLKKSGGSQGSEARVFIECKKLTQDNNRLKKDISDLTLVLQQEQEDRQFEQARHTHKLNRVLSQANQMQATCEQLRQTLQTLRKDQVNNSITLKKAQKIQLDALAAKLKEFADFQHDQQESLQEAHNDLYQENNELIQAYRQQKEDFDRELQELQVKMSNEAEEMGETKEMVLHLNSENERLIDEITHLQSQNAQLQSDSEIVQRLNQDLNQKIGTLMRQIAGSDDVQGLSLQESLVILQVKSREMQFMQQRNQELEKMLEEKDEEILELMRDNDRYQERVASPNEQPHRQYLASQLTQINEETSSVAQTVGQYMEHQSSEDFDHLNLRLLSSEDPELHRAGSTVHRSTSHFQIGDESLQRRATMHQNTSGGSPQLFDVPKPAELDFFSQLVNESKPTPSQDPFDFFASENVIKIDKKNMLLDAIFSKLTPPKTTVVDIPASPQQDGKASNQELEDEPMLNDDNGWGMDQQSAFDDEPLMEFEAQHQKQNDETKDSKISSILSDPFNGSFARHEADMVLTTMNQTQEAGQEIAVSDLDASIKTSVVQSSECSSPQKKKDSNYETLKEIEEYNEDQLERSRVPSEGWYDYQEVTVEEMIDVIGKQTPLKQAEHNMVVEELNSVMPPSKVQSQANPQPSTMVADPFQFQDKPQLVTNLSDLPSKNKIVFDANETACFEQTDEERIEQLAFFTVNPMVLRNATYGEEVNKQALIEKEIKKKLGVDESVEESLMSFNQKPDSFAEVKDGTNSLDFGSTSMRSHDGLFQAQKSNQDSFCFNGSGVVQFDGNNSKVDDSRYSDFPQVVVQEMEDEQFQDELIQHDDALEQDDTGQQSIPHQVGNEQGHAPIDETWGNSKEELGEESKDVITEQGKPSMFKQNLTLDIDESDEDRDDKIEAGEEASRLETKESQTMEAQRFARDNQSTELMFHPDEWTKKAAEPTVDGWEEVGDLDIGSDLVSEESQEVQESQVEDTTLARQDNQTSAEGWDDPDLVLDDSDIEV